MTRFEGLNSPDRARRRKAALALAGTTDPAAQAELVRLLADPEPSVVEAAISALAASRDVRTARAAAAALRDDRAAVRAAAADVLRRLGDLALEELIALAAQPDPSLRRLACELLPGCSRHRVLPVLTGLLDDPCPNVRMAAAEGCRGLGAREAVPHLVARLRVEEDEWVRFALLEVLRDLGDEDAVLDVLLVPCTGELSRRAYVDLVAALGGVRTVRGALAGISRAGQVRLQLLEALAVLASRLPAEESGVVSEEEVKPLFDLLAAGGEEACLAGRTLLWWMGEAGGARLEAGA
ncbi:MAG: HEAT repeat domain-containing protein [Bacillota bacterium]